MVTERREEVPLHKLFEAVLPYHTSGYVTALNIIQCIALAFWINEAREIIIKKEVSDEWVLRSTVALGVILVVWDRYVSELQYLWVVSWFDTLIPFLMGIIECWIIFSMNPKTVSLGAFILSITVLHWWVVIGYLYAYRRRIKRITEKLYQTFYAAYPQFASHLTNFLKGYDWWQFKIFVVFSIISSLFLVFITLFPNDYNELIFPAIYIFELIQGEFLNNFQKALRKDKSVGPYFQ